MADQLSGIAIIICIAFGVLTFILLFIFAKRQITRFALKSRRGPHVAIGLGASTKLVQEIERRLDAVSQMKFDPSPFNEDKLVLFTDPELSKQITPTHLYRAKVMHDAKELECIIFTRHSTKRRYFDEDVQSYFMRMYRVGVFNNLNLSVLQNYLALYEIARHEPQEFLYKEYCHFQELLKCIKNSLLLPLPNIQRSIDNETMLAGENQDNVHFDESTSMLLNRTLSFEIDKSRVNAPCETPV